MQTNGGKYQFDYGKKGYYNMSTSTKKFDKYVIFDTTSLFDLLARQSGHIDEEFEPILFFLKKSELGWTPAQHDVNCIQPMIKAAKEFVTLMQNSNELVNSIEILGGAKMHINLLDANASGIEVKFKIELRTADPICVANDPNNG